MRRFTFKKGIMTFTLLLCSLGAWASITWDETTKTLTLDNVTQDEQNQFSTYITDDQCKLVEKIVVKGAYNSFGNIRSKFTEGTLKELDMTDMPVNSDGTFSYWPGKDGAFGKVTTVKLPNNLTTIVSGALLDYTNLTSITIPNTVTTIGSQAFKNCSSLTSITLPSSLTTIGANAFQESGLTSITIPASVETIGQAAFKDCTDLTEVTFNETSHIATIEPDVFTRTKISNMVFPTSIKLIEAGAFTECYGLKTMTFPEGIEGLTIEGGNAEGGAFSNCTNITDIYIETTNHITCNINGYPWAVTYAQGDPSRPTATLHFPDGQAEYYTNLGHPLTIDIASDTGRFHDWLMAHVEEANNAKPKNGWWQFINSGSDTGTPSTEGKFLRTFSDPKYARIVPRGVKAYAVTDVKKNVDKSTAKHPYYEVSFMILDVIPKNTGVILFGEPNTTSKDGTGKTLTMTVISLAEADKSKGTYDAVNHIFTLSESGEEMNLIDGTEVYDASGNHVRTVDLSLRRKNWENLADEHVHFKNYLEPSTVGDAEYTELQPYKKEDDGKAYRYFGFSHYRKSATGKADNSFHGKDSKEAYDYAGFFRCKKSKIGPGKAYLKLEDSEYSEPNGGEIIIPKTCQDITYNVYKDNGTVEELTFNYRDEYSGQSDSWVKWAETSPYWHNAIWTLPEMFGERDENQEAFAAEFKGEIVFDENEDGTATMIIPASMIEGEEDGDYYTLQGVKVANPSKGIYIKNGKKVVLK